MQAGNVFQDAKRPADKVNPVGLEIGCYGDLAQACSQRIIEGHGKSTKVKLDQMFNKVPLAEEFPLNANSQLVTFSPNDIKVNSKIVTIHPDGSSSDVTTPRKSRQMP